MRGKDKGARPQALGHGQNRDPRPPAATGIDKHQGLMSFSNVRAIGSFITPPHKARFASCTRSARNGFGCPRKRGKKGRLPVRGKTIEQPAPRSSCVQRREVRAPISTSLGSRPTGLRRAGRGDQGVKTGTSPSDFIARRRQRARLSWKAGVGGRTRQVGRFEAQRLFASPERIGLEVLADMMRDYEVSQRVRLVNLADRSIRKSWPW